MAIDNPSNILPDQEIIIEGDAGLVPKASSEDAENAEGGVIVDRAVIEQHRKDVLDKLHSMRTPKSEMVRKWRERQRVEDPEGYERYKEQERRRSKARYDRMKAEKEAEKASRNASVG